MPPKQNTNQKLALQLRLKGPAIQNGGIPLPDLIRICEEVQNAVNRQAESFEGRKTIHPGPTALFIQEECTLALTGIKEKGSLLEFTLAKSQISLPLKKDGHARLAINVIAELADTIKSLGEGIGKLVDPGVLQGIHSLSSVIYAKGVSEIGWIVPKHGNRGSVTAPITQFVRAAVASQLRASRKKLTAIEGILDMADFKGRESTCRIDPPVGASIVCTFGPELEDRICQLLRQPVRARGEASFQPDSDRIGIIHIAEIEAITPLLLKEETAQATPEDVANKSA